MTNHERVKAFRNIPARRNYAWKFESGSHHDSRKWRVCMQQRGWIVISVMLPDGILFGRPFPHCMFALMENEPDIVMLFDGPGEFEKLHYYLDHRASIHKKYNVRQLDALLDYHFYEPDAGYSYRWEDGMLIEGSYMDRILNRRYKESEDVAKSEAFSTLYIP